MSGSNTSTQNTSQNTTQQFRPDAGVMAEWGNIEGTAQGLANWAMNNQPPQASVAGPTGLTASYWNQAGNLNAPDFSGLQQAGGDIYNNAGAQQSNPQGINLPQNFNFTPGNLPTGYVQQNPFQTSGSVYVGQGGGPFGGGQTVSGDASHYMVNPQQVQAQQVQAPAAIADINARNLLQVTPQQLQQYQMGPAQQVTAPQLRDLSMQAAANVAPQAQVGPQSQVGTGSFTAPGIAASYMSPYTQQVVNAQLAQAQVQEQQQLEQQRSQAAQAGAFGGSRQAVEEANTSIGYQQLASQIQATGLQNAFQQAQAQFNTEQQQALAAQQFNVGTGLQAQQFNVGTGLQASLANQQAQQQANLQNLSAALQTQGLSAQTGMTAQQLNQAAGLTVGQQNLAALLGVQQLGSTQNLQAQQLNQAQGLQAALANQQASEFSAGQQLQAGLANAQMGLQAGLANQQAGLQAGLAAQQMGLQGAEFTSGQQQQAALANQAAAMQSLGLQYQGGLQAALAQNQMGMQGAEFGGQLGLQGATQQEQLRQSQAGINLNANAQQQNAVNLLANLGQMSLGDQLNILGALAAPAASQQGFAQQQADTAFQNQMQNLMFPFQATNWAGQMMAQQPLPYSTTGTQTGTTTLTTPGPSLFSQILGGVLGAAGIASGFGGVGALGGLGKLAGTGAHGGLVKHGFVGGGIAHPDAAADRRQVLQILREKGLTKANGGPIQMKRRHFIPRPKGSMLQAA